MRRLLKGGGSRLSGRRLRVGIIIRERSCREALVKYDVTRVKECTCDSVATVPGFDTWRIPHKDRFP
jgi:hypothetical protein